MISNCHIYSELKLVERIIQMQEATISIHVGTRFSKAHNKRLVKGLEHIEYSPTEAGRGFFVLEEHDKNQLYVELFADSLEEFNERQKRNDRKIDYLTNGQPDGEKILKYMRSLKGREREVIFQVGKYSDCIDKNLKVEILKEMYEQFKTDNPNLKIIASYLHNDEADPHLHVDFIPVFTNTGKGVGKMVGFDKALCEQMGIQYERSAKGKNAKGEEINLNRRYHAPWFEQWRLMNHTQFSRLLHNYDIVPIKGGISNHRHKNTAEYQKKQDSMKTLQNSQDETIEEKGRKMEYFEKDLLFRDDEHLKNACNLFSILIKTSFDDFRKSMGFNNVPAFIFLSSAVMDEKDSNNLSLETLYNANLTRYKHEEFDISQTSKIANEFLNKKFNLDGYEDLSEEYQLIVKNAFDIYTSCLEIYESKLIRMFEIIESYTKEMTS